MIKHNFCMAYNTNFQKGFSKSDGQIDLLTVFFLFFFFLLLEIMAGDHFYNDRNTNVYHSHLQKHEINRKGPSYPKGIRM